MKKLTFLSLATCTLLMLGACSTSAVKESVKEAVSTVTAQEEEETTRRFQFNQDIESVQQDITEVITYKGEEWLSMDIKVQSSFDEEFKKELEGLDSDTVNELILSGIEEEEYLRELTELDGVEMTSEVDEEFNYTVNVAIDFQVADPQKLSELTTIGDILPDLTSTTPEDYIQNLLDNGAKEL